MKSTLAKLCLLSLCVAQLLFSQETDAPSQEPETTPDAHTEEAPEKKEAIQTGVINGEVFDEDTKGPLAGVTIAVENTNLETQSDSTGLYRFENVPVGEQVLLFFKPGFERVRMTEVTVVAGQPRKQDLVMKKKYDDFDQLEDFVITADDANKISIELLAERKNESSFVSSIGAEDFTKQGASDAAGALKKVTGVTIQGGKYAVVRGLGGRYSNTTLNGVILPSPDPDKKAVHMDLFPTGLLDSIVTAKTFTPDMPGDFSGGSINLRTKSMPESLAYSYSASLGFNPNANLIDNFWGEKGGSDDWMGMDDGTRALPQSVAELETSDWPFSRIVRQDSDVHNFFKEVTDAFSKSVVPKRRSTQLNHGFGASFQNYWNLNDKIPFGVVGSFSYSRDYKHYENGIQQRISGLNGTPVISERYTNFVGGNQSWGPAESSGDSKSTESVTWGGLIEATMKPSENNTFKLSFLHNQATDDNARVLQGFNSKEGDTILFEDIYDQQVTITSLHYIERALTSVQTKGTHILPGFRDSKIEWNLASAETSQSEPDVRMINRYWSFRFERNVYPQQEVPPQRIFRDLTETSDSFDVAMTVPFDIPKVKSHEFKFGALRSEKARDFSEKVFRYNRIRGRSRQDHPGEDFEYWMLERPEDVTAIGNPNYDYAFFLNRGEFIKYDGTDEVDALFLMGDTKFNDKWRAIYGMRQEKTNIDIERTEGAQIEGSSASSGSLFEKTPMPAFSLVFSPSEQTNYRAAVSKTLARPTFRELAPYLSFPYIGGTRYEGDPTLDLTNIVNFDLRWEHYPSEQEIIGVSLFYKEMEEVIVNYAFERSGNFYTRPTNADKGMVYGIELEAKKSLGDWHSKLENLFLNTNFTYTFAEIDVPEELKERMRLDRVPEDRIPNTRRLTGQPEYIFNLGLGYERPDLRWNLYLNYGYVSSKLQSISAGLAPEIYDAPQHSLDLITTKSLGENWSVKFSAKNLLDYPIEQYYEDGDETIFSSYKTGISYSLGASYSFR